MSWVGRIFSGSPAQAANAAAVPHASADVMIHPEQDPTNREQTLAAKRNKTPALQSPAADPAAQQHAFQVQEQLPAGMGRDWGMMSNLFGQGGDNLTSDVPPPAEPPTKATFDLDSEPSSSSMTANGSGIDGKGRSTGLQQPLMSEAARIATTLPTWRQQMTFRALLVGLLLGIAFSLITLKLNITAGVIPGFGLPSCLLGFAMIRGFAAASAKLGWSMGLYSPQEITVVQTMVSSVSDLPFSGGFANYLLGMNNQTYTNLVGQSGNRPQDVYEPTLGRIIPYQICIAFIGIFMVMIIKKTIIIDWGLPFPNSKAAGELIKGLHTKRGAANAMIQVKTLGYTSLAAFVWDFFEWFFAGNSNCTGGWANYPTFGLAALKYTWNFNFELTFVGVGFLVPQVINYSMMVGAVVFFGILLPLIHNKAGEWYPEEYSELSTKDIRGVYGYQQFIALSLFLGDGLYAVAKVTFVAALGITQRLRERKKLPEHRTERTKFIGRKVSYLTEETPEEKALAEYVFQHDVIPWWVPIGGYICFIIIGSAVIPAIYPPAKWYVCFVIFLIAPIFTIVNSYGAGLTDWNVASVYGLLATLIGASWIGENNGGVIGGLAACGILYGATNAGASVTGDFKTGYFTLAAPKAMFFTQLLGECAGVIIAPMCFYLYNSAFALGVPGTEWAAPFATLNRAVAVVAVEGLGHLPKNCLSLCAGFFFAAILMAVARDWGRPAWLFKYVPVPMAMGIPAVVGAWLAVDMCVGGVILFIWEKFNFEAARVLAVPVASGLIVGEGVWALPQAILQLAQVTAPVCMSFFSGAAPTTS